jgi:hypothetical protein
MKLPRLHLHPGDCLNTRMFAPSPAPHQSFFRTCDHFQFCALPLGWPPIQVFQAAIIAERRLLLEAHYSLRVYRAYRVTSDGHAGRTSDPSTPPQHGDFDCQQATAPVNTEKLRKDLLQTFRPQYPLSTTEGPNAESGTSSVSMCELWLQPFARSGSQWIAGAGCDLGALSRMWREVQRRYR